MFEKLFSKKSTLSVRDTKIEEMSKHIQAWNFEQIQEYIRGRMKTPELNDFGLAAIIARFLTSHAPDVHAPSGFRREMEPSDTLERTKKGFDILLAVIGHNKLSPESLDNVPPVIERYKDVIEAYDTKMKQTYIHKFKATYQSAQVAALTKAQMRRELQVTSF